MHIITHSKTCFTAHIPVAGSWRAQLLLWGMVASYNNPHTRCFALTVQLADHRDLIEGTDKIIDISTKCHSILSNILSIQVGSSTTCSIWR